MHGESEFGRAALDRNSGARIRDDISVDRAVVRGRASSEHSRGVGLLPSEARRAQPDVCVPAHRVSVRDHRGCDCAGAVAADGDSELPAAQDAGWDRARELKMGELKMDELKTTAPRIAIPVPHSGDREYAERALPQYEEAVRGAGGEPVRIELDQTPVQVMNQIERCDAVLLPGSGADVDPRKYSADRHEKTASAAAPRDMVDDLLLRDAYNLHKPVLGICYGLQSLNVYRSGSLVQHIESAIVDSKIDHSAGRAVPKAHTVQIEPESKLAEIVGASKTVAVNSSHHQSA